MVNGREKRKQFIRKLVALIATMSSQFRGRACFTDKSSIDCATDSDRNQAQINQFIYDETHAQSKQ
jgi:aspartate/glutamate racemase